jgi:hypothetical protein
MTPTSEQVDEISEVLAFLLTDFSEETSQEEESTGLEGQEPISEEALARILAKSLSTRGGDAHLRGLLGAARGVLRGSMEIG